MPSDESKGSQLDAIGSLAQRQLDNTLGVIERVCESPRGSVQRSVFDLDDTIVPARLEDLAVETRWPEEATDDLLGCFRNQVLAAAA